MHRARRRRLKCAAGNRETVGADVRRRRCARTVRDVVVLEIEEDLDLAAAQNAQGFRPQRERLLADLERANVRAQRFDQRPRRSRSGASTARMMRWRAASVSLS
jgi:hypothetical protein